MENQHENKNDEKHISHKREKLITKPIIALIVIATLLILFNQLQISSISGLVTAGSGFKGSGMISLSGDKDLADINLADLKSTGHTIAAVFPVEDKIGRAHV